jgi:hypothetical protein
MFGIISEGCKGHDWIGFRMELTWMFFDHQRRAGASLE